LNEDEDILHKVCNDAKDIDEGEDILKVVSGDSGDISEKVIDEGKDKLFMGQKNRRRKKRRRKKERKNNNNNKKKGLDIRRESPDELHAPRRDSLRIMCTS